MWIIFLIMVGLFLCGFALGKTYTESKSDKYGTDGEIYWDERGINMKLDISIAEIAAVKDYVVFKVVHNKDILQGLRTIDKESNRIEEKEDIDHV